MKSLLFVLVCLMAVGCSQRKTNQALGISFKKRINDFHSKEIVSIKAIVNDKTELIFFEDSIDGIDCAFYSKTEIENIDSVGYSKRMDDVKVRLKEESVLLLIGKEDYRNIEIRDSRILLPTYLASFLFRNERYLVINLNLVSFMAGSYWQSIVIYGNKTYIIESGEPINENNFGDYDGDGTPEYVFKNSSGTEDEKVNTIEIIHLRNVSKELKSHNR